MRKDINWYLLCKIQEGVNVDVINSIIELGATVNAINPFTKETALIMAVRKSNFEVIQLILDKTNLINYQDENGKTALIYAVDSSDRYVVRLLIDKNADIKIVDKNNKRAIDYAMSDAIKEIFENILKQESIKEKKKSIKEGEFILYDYEILDKEFQNENNDRREHCLQLLHRSGSVRELIKTQDDSITMIQSLESNFPNFIKAIDFFIEQLHLCNLTDDRVIQLKPLLLLGPAGIGKTQFCHAVASALQLSLNMIQCNTVTAGFVLAGGAAQWSGAKQGKISSIMRDSKEGNTFILLDEIDKMSGHSNYDCYGCLYSLLEQNTAKNFVDELVDMPIDCSRINWIATSNDINSIPIPIRSRFSILELREPNKNELINITASIYNNILKENEWGKRFTENLDEGLISLLVNISPRQIKAVLIKACGRAVKSRKCETYTLRIEDIDLGLTDKKPSIGFVA
jgi:DNA polymerase III delta prime subunit